MAIQELKEKKSWKIALKVFCIVLLVWILVVGGYFIYAFASYYRLPDHMSLKIHEKEVATEGSEIVNTNDIYTISTYNIGFGAYTPDFSFFMDGGTESWAFSKESCEGAIQGVIHTLDGYQPDFMLIQEIDVDATRSYHIDQLQMLTEGFPEYNWVYAQNYDSPFLMYPLRQPHGASKAGICVYSKYPITEGERRSFPVSNSVSRMLDLDRCFEVVKIPVSNGKNLVLLNLHMSAYGSDDSVREGQIDLLLEEMNKAYEAGDYIICGGDFNHDLSLAETDTAVASWAYPFERSKLPSYLHFSYDDLSESEKGELAMSARDDDTGYQPGITKEFMLDGFIISDNVEMVSYEVHDDDFAYSDHEPVIMGFRLLD